MTTIEKVFCTVCVITETVLIFGTIYILLNNRVHNCKELSTCLFILWIWAMIENFQLYKHESEDK